MIIVVVTLRLPGIRKFRFVLVGFIDESLLFVLDDVPRMLGVVLGRAAALFEDSPFLLKSREDTVDA